MSSSGGTLYSVPPPPGITPDWHNPYQATSLFVIIGVLLPMAVVSVVIRIFTRSQIVRSVAADDYIMIFALLTSIALCGCILDLLNYGLGKHLYDVPLDVLYPKFLKVNLIAAVLFCAATGMAKTSILLFYLRIFPRHVFHWIVWGLVVFTIGYSSASVLVNVFSCKPIAASWDIRYVKTAKCINRPVFYFAQAGLGILTDFATVIAPLPMMWNLRLPSRQKIGIAGILTMGGFVCIISIIRLKSLYVLLRSSDLTIDTVNALLWCVVELNLSIVGGCAPTLRPFIRRYWPSVLGSSGGMYGTGDAAHGKNYQAHSHPLQSFDKSGLTPKGTITRVVIWGGDTTMNNNDSEEYIIQHENSSQEESGCGKIVKTVNYGYENNKERKQERRSGPKDDSARG